jgi:hypothetical protein
MTIQVISNGDGTFTLVDADTTIKMWNGSAIVEIPKQVFKGTLAQATQRLTMATTQVANATTTQATAQAICDAISSIPTPTPTPAPVDNPTA